MEEIGLSNVLPPPGSSSGSRFEIVGQIPSTVDHELKREDQTENSLVRLQHPFHQTSDSNMLPHRPTYRMTPKERQVVTMPAELSKALGDSTTGVDI